MRPECVRGAAWLSVTYPMDLALSSINLSVSHIAKSFPCVALQLSISPNDVCMASSFEYTTAPVPDLVIDPSVYMNVSLTILYYLFCLHSSSIKVGSSDHIVCWLRELPCVSVAPIPRFACFDGLGSRNLKVPFAAGPLLTNHVVTDLRWLSGQSVGYF